MDIRPCRSCGSARSDGLATDTRAAFSSGSDTAPPTDTERHAEPRQRTIGRATQVITPLGIEITRLIGSPQRIAGRYSAQTDGVWLAILLPEGDTSDGPGATLASNGKSWPLAVGAIGCGPLAADAVLTLPRSFSMLYVRLPRLALHFRLLAPTPLRVGVLDPTPGIRRVLAGFLQSLGQSLEAMDTRQLRAIELALSELLIGCVLSDPAYGGGDPPLNRRIAAMHSLCQLIRSELTDPDLTMTAIARKHGISPRGLQKLLPQLGRISVSIFGSAVSPVVMTILQARFPPISPSQRSVSDGASTTRRISAVASDRLMI